MGAEGYLTRGMHDLMQAQYHADNLPLIEQFKVEVHDANEELEPDLDILSLTVGWAIAKGMKPGAAYDFALHIRYQTTLG